MLFQTQPFILVFLPLTLAAFWLCAGSERWRQYALIAASLVFYSYWDVRFLPLLLGQIGITWVLARLSSEGRNLPVIVLGVLVNLGSLATFKYLDFLTTALETATGLALPRAGLVLPIGISFFSFQLISYLVDLRRGDAPLYPLRPFALFVLVFPHLIAGPIVRHNELVPQFALDPRRPGLAQRFSVAGALFALGLAKKVLLADHLGPVADELFGKAVHQTLSFGEAWTAALAFTFQLFLDFSAYTEMAIGIALMFGLVLPENFRQPYLSTSMRDFWRRWHISLSNFIRDYLYIPLGGSRRGEARYVIATLLTMAICGLWHGAGWTYVAWGVWHGIGLIVCRYWQRLGTPMPAPLAWLVTMLFVIAGWVVFRAVDFSSAGSILQSMAGLNGFSGKLEWWRLLLGAAVVSLFVPSAHTLKDRCIFPHPLLAFVIAIVAAICVLEIGKGAPTPFIYFQF
jgi:alginate O-acetyltransferase complex protein AlgI